MSPREHLGSTVNKLEHVYHDLRVARVLRETGDAVSLVLEVPEALRATYEYVAGQFLTFKVPYGQGELIRCYSLASSPEADREHKVTIKRVKDGRASNWINDGVREGDVLSVLPPGGLFTLDSSERDLLMFAGGSGITPVISIIKTVLLTGERTVHLVYANRDERSIIFREELDGLAAANPGRLTISHSLDDRDGFLTVNGAGAHISVSAEAEFYLCGPAPFMEVVKEAFEALAVAPGRVHIEVFVSPEADAAEQAAGGRAFELQEGDEVPAKLVVHLDGDRHEIPYERGQTVLATLRAVGLEPPFSCTDGYCGCCMAKVEEGQVRMLNNDFLAADDIADGWVLTCQSCPVGPRCELSYPD